MSIVKTNPAVSKELFTDTYKCSGCGCSWTGQLKNTAMLHNCEWHQHPSQMHSNKLKPGAFAKAVQAETDKAVAYISFWPSIKTITNPTQIEKGLALYETTKEASPMATTETKTPFLMKGSDVAAAKKRRDQARKIVRETIAKMVESYGCSEFEAAHSITDTVLNDVNQRAKNYDTAKLVNNLAQTYLPETLAMATGTAPVLSSDEPTSSGPSTINLGKILNDPWAMTPTVTTKKVAAKPITLKADKYVSEKDAAANFIVHEFDGYTGSSKAKKYIEEHQSNDKTYYLLKGKEYVVGKGSQHLVYAIKKTCPYVTAGQVNKYNLVAPYHYKWKKVYNKPMYKLVFDKKNPPMVDAPVSSGDVNKEQQKNAVPGFEEGTYHGALLASGDEVPMGIAVKIIPAAGYHWETLHGSNGATAIYCKGGKDYYEKIVKCTPGYAFPSKEWLNANYGKVYASPWGIDMYANDDPYKASPSGW